MNDSPTIIKVGTGVLTNVEDGTLNGGMLVRLVTAIATLMKGGERVIFVSSGAVGSGVASLGLDHYPKDLVKRQAAAALGQVRLMHTYETLFRQFDLDVAQLLLTGANLRTEETRARICDVVAYLLSTGRILPIVNENDSVAIEELAVGDNDMLSARLAGVVNAKQLILLTSVDGLMDKDGDVISEVRDLTSVREHVGSDRGRFSIGGMASKLDAVERALQSGIPTVIANGKTPEVLSEILNGGGICTRFIPPAE